MPTAATFPNIRPTLLLDFANAGRLSPLVTFTRASNATYFDETGILRTAANNVPRFDYNPATLEAQGLLIEEARTNLLLRSEEFNDAAWTKTNSSITANAATAPSGTVTADKLIEALDVNLVHACVQGAITVVSLATYTASCYVKADTRTRVRLGFLVGGTSGVVADANLTAGTIGAASAFGGGSAVGSSIQAINNGWYRITVSGTGAAGTSGECRLELLDASGNRQYNGDGTSGLFIWNAQLEAGAFATSVIPTTTTALTRSADAASVSTLSPWFNATEGTIYSEFSAYNTFASRALAQLDDTGFNNRIFAFVQANNGIQTNVIVGGASVAQLFPAGTYTSPAIGKISQSYAVNNFASCFNGGAVSTDTSGAIPTVTQMRIGFDGGSAYANGHIRRITYYPRRLSNAELQAITA